MPSPGRRRVRSVLLLALALAASMLGAAVATPAQASNPGFLLTADEHYRTECGAFWPSRNTFETGVGAEGYTATWKFRLSQAEINSLQCLRSRYNTQFIELDFRLFNFAGQESWDGYAAYSNLPSAIHDVGYTDTAAEATPGVTGVFVSQLVPEQDYYASLTWNNQSGLYPAPSQPVQSVSFRWVPSHWSSLSSPRETFSCDTHYHSAADKGWCVFGDVSAYVSDGYRDDSPVTFSGYQSYTYPTAAPQQFYHGYVPDGMIVQNQDGHNLYAAAGGRLFYFDQTNAPLREALLTQRRQRYGEIPFPVMADTDIHAVEVNRDNAGAYAPGSHMPADNTFLYQYGNPQQFVIKYEHPFAVASMEEAIRLGGQDRAVMVPPGLADLQAHPAHWVENDLLQFGTDPSVWHYAGDRGFRVPSVPTRDCLSVRWNRGVTPMPAAAWNYFPTHPTQLAACDFADGQWLLGPGGHQAVVLYGAGYSVGSPEEAVALGGQNRAMPVSAETMQGLLARTGSLPNDELIKSYNDPRVYHIVDNKLHYVGSPATRDCLSARSGRTVRTVPIDLIGRMQASGQTGPDAYCELENRQLLAPNGVNVAYIKDGYKRPVPNPAIRDCLAVRAGAGQPLPVSDNVWGSYTAGPNAYCPYETEVGLNFVRDPAQPDIVWLVGPGTGSTPGVKRHAGALCVPDPDTTQLKKYHVWTVPAGETGGHIQGPDWWPTTADCQALPG